MIDPKTFERLDADVHISPVIQKGTALRSPFGITTLGDDYAMIDIVDQSDPEGGIKTWLRGFKHPFPGFPHEQAVRTLALIKRIVPAIANFFSKKPMRTVLGAVFLTSKNTFNKIINQGIEAFVKFAYPPLKHLVLNPKKYSRPVRELHRAITVMIERESHKNMKEKFEQLRDIVCMFLEYDNAYRLRMQDFLSIINTEETNLTEADWYFCVRREDYDFGGRKKAAKETPSK